MPDLALATALVQGLIAFQSVLFALVLSTTGRGKRDANWLLAAFLLVLAWQMLGNLQPRGGLLPYLNPALGLLYGPLQYGYARSLLLRDLRWRAAHLLHAGPFVLAVVLMPTRLDILYFALAIYASLALYLGAIVRLLGRYRRARGATHAQGDALRLSWLGELLAMAIVILIADASHFWIDYGRIEGLRPVARLVLFVLLLVLVLRFVIQGWRHPGTLVGVTHEDLALAREATVVRRAVSVADPALRADADALLVWLAAHRAELDPGLTLRSLATRLGWTPRRLSKVINGALGQTFSELVNRRRVAHAEKLLTDQPERSVLDVLQACGFASKSTFNDTFKRYTGTTPTDHRRGARLRGAGRSPPRTSHPLPEIEEEMV